MIASKVGQAYELKDETKGFFCVHALRFNGANARDFLEFLDNLIEMSIRFLPPSLRSRGVLHVQRPELCANIKEGDFLVKRRDGTVFVMTEQGFLTTYKLCESGDNDEN